MEQIAEGAAAEVAMFRELQVKMAEEAEAAQRVTRLAQQAGSACVAALAEAALAEARVVGDEAEVERVAVELVRQAAALAEALRVAEAEAAYQCWLLEDEDVPGGSAHVQLQLLSSP
jgi:hypothetical protein